MSDAEGTTHCASETCGALVWKIDVPSKRTGNCWRCEVKRLNAEVKRLKESDDASHCETQLLLELKDE